MIQPFSTTGLVGSEVSGIGFPFCLGSPLGCSAVLSGGTDLTLAGMTCDGRHARPVQTRIPYLATPDTSDDAAANYDVLCVVLDRLESCMRGQLEACDYRTQQQLRCQSYAVTSSLR